MAEIDSPHEFPLDRIFKVLVWSVKWCSIVAIWGSIPLGLWYLYSNEYVSTTAIIVFSVLVAYAMLWLAGFIIYHSLLPDVYKHSKM
jgi:hypothetical protein